MGRGSRFGRWNVCPLPPAPCPRPPGGGGPTWVTLREAWFWTRPRNDNPSPRAYPVRSQRDDPPDDDPGRDGHYGRTGTQVLSKGTGISAAMGFEAPPHQDPRGDGYCPGEHVADRALRDSPPRTQGLEDANQPRGEEPQAEEAPRDRSSVDDPPEGPQVLPLCSHLSRVNTSGRGRYLAVQARGPWRFQFRAAPIAVLRGHATLSVPRISLSSTTDPRSSGALLLLPPTSFTTKSLRAESGAGMPGRVNREQSPRAVRKVSQRDTRRRRPRVASCGAAPGLLTAAAAFRKRVASGVGSPLATLFITTLSSCGQRSVGSTTGSGIGRGIRTPLP